MRKYLIKKLYKSLDFFLIYTIKINTNMKNKKYIKRFNETEENLDMYGIIESTKSMVEIYCLSTIEVNLKNLFDKEGWSKLELKEKISSIIDRL